MPGPYSGFEGKVFSGSTDMEVKEWSASVKVDPIDVTTTAGNGYKQKLTGTKEVTGKFTVFYKTEINPFSAALNCSAGQKPTLYLHVGGGDSLNGVALITENAVKSATTEGISVEISFENDGPWNEPGV